MRKVKLSKEEQSIENALLKGEYVSLSNEEQQSIVEAINFRKKDRAIYIRINGNDLKNIKEKAAKLGIKYQKFITEILHKVAQA